MALNWVEQSQPVASPITPSKNIQNLWYRLFGRAKNDHIPPVAFGPSENDHIPPVVRLRSNWRPAGTYAAGAPDAMRPSSSYQCHHHNHHCIVICYHDCNHCLDHSRHIGMTNTLPVPLRLRFNIGNWNFKSWFQTVLKPYISFCLRATEFFPKQNRLWEWTCKSVQFVIERNELSVKLVALFLIACLLCLACLRQISKSSMKTQIHVWFSLDDLTSNIFRTSSYLRGQNALWIICPLITGTALAEWNW